ncbi:MAG: T9SS type A sorting domain-containing protein [Cyclobacteriaceae bacterium]
MRGFFIVSVISVLTALDFNGCFAQQMVSVKPEKPIICYYSNENRPDHVGISETFRKWRGNAGGRKKTAIFDVDYINFPADNLAKKAFQFAVEIWQSHLISTIPIKIRAEWMSLEQGVLGQAIWGRSYANFGGEQHSNTFYPVALAEKIARKELNESNEPDIVASFNSKTVWYYGTDGKTPTGQIDLVTIVLHEIAHGLGFTDTYDLEGAEGRVGLATGAVSAPFIFDLFVENVSAKNLIDDFESPSTALGTELESGNLFFNSPLSRAALGGQRPKLFAPSEFDAGSSISHLDESSFNAPGDANRLMTPQIAKAESIHNPGNVLLAILSDLGWVYTNIEHEPLKDTEIKNGQPFIIKAVINSDNGYLPNEVKLHYTIDGTNFIVLNMTPTGLPNEFKSSLPGTTIEQGYAYFISAVDNANRTFTNPGLIHESGIEPEQGTHFFNVGPDLAGPVISHQPVENLSESVTTLEILAEVTDNLGLKEVLVEYFVNDGIIQTEVMAKTIGTDEYTASIMLPDLVIDDKIKYRLIARDVAEIENVSFLPVSGFFTVLITGIKPLQISYVNNFNTPSDDFFGNNFSITAPVGFDNGAIHSNHPYQNGTGPNEESNYVYQLQIPILIDDTNPFIRFDEIVLVEPGADGSIFGDEDFFDYVIVEGSTDDGATWKPFADGYDSRADSSWLSLYNDSVTDENSDAQGDKKLFRERLMDMTANGNFFQGDEVLIRFRLFADALAHGWGWAVDNLSIQGPITGAEESIQTAFKLYPVPVKYNLIVEFLNPKNDVVTIEITDVQGRNMYAEQATSNTGRIIKNIDVQFLKPGFYLLKATSRERIYSRKFLKIGD